MAKRRTTRRRATRRRSTARRGFNLVPAGTLPTVLSTAGGFVGTALLTQKIPFPASMRSGYGLVASKAIVAIGAGMILRKFAGSKAGTAFTVGGLTAAALDLYQQMRGGSVSGLGYADFAAPYPMAGLGYSGRASPTSVFLDDGVDGLGYSGHANPRSIFLDDGVDGLGYAGATPTLTGMDN